MSWGWRPSGFEKGFRSEVRGGLTMMSVVDSLTRIASILAAYLEWKSIPFTTFPPSDTSLSNPPIAKLFLHVQSWQKEVAV